MKAPLVEEPANAWERCRSPEATVQTVRAYFPEFGITRVADQTGLDFLGIPTFSAIRPNGALLATSQGKGLTPEAAMASAVMEAVEHARAECPRTQVITGSAARLRTTGFEIYDPAKFRPLGAKFDQNTNARWGLGRRLGSGQAILVPEQVYRLASPTQPLGEVCFTSNGLASGNTRQEALFHALCELIERDASTLWPLGKKSGCAIDLESIVDSNVRDLASKISGSGLRLTLFDQTTDIGVPCIMALISSKDPTRYFDVAAGYGCHPITARAMLRAITEAAQSRVTNIVGARDDFDPSEFSQEIPYQTIALLEARSVGPAPRDLAHGTLDRLLPAVIDALQNCGVTDVIEVELNPGCQDFSVVRLISNILEDRDANLHWRPGARAISAMLSTI